MPGVISFRARVRANRRAPSSVKSTRVSYRLAMISPEFHFSYPRYFNFFFFLFLSVQTKWSSKNDNSIKFRFELVPNFSKKRQLLKRSNFFPPPVFFQSWIPILSRYIVPYSSRDKTNSHLWILNSIIHLWIIYSSCSDLVKISPAHKRFKRLGRYASLRIFRGVSLDES